MWSAWPWVSTTARTYGGGATLDVPGAPRVILAPGHSPGSCALHVPGRSVLFAGDTLGTLSVTTGATVTGCPA